jgi:hypothetical protein
MNHGGDWSLLPFRAYIFFYSFCYILLRQTKQRDDFSIRGELTTPPPIRRLPIRRLWVFAFVWHLDADHFAKRAVRIAKKHIASFRLDFFCSFVKSHGTAKDFTARKASCLLKILHILRKIKRHADIKPHWRVQYSHLWESVVVVGGAP